jgi:hypothetical protein
VLPAWHAPLGELLTVAHGGKCLACTGMGKVAGGVGAHGVARSRQKLSQEVPGRSLD